MDQLVRASGIDRVLSVHKCAYRDKSCSILSLIGDFQHPDEAPIRPWTLYRFGETSCTNLTAHDALLDNTHLTSCGDGSERPHHLSTVVSFRPDLEENAAEFLQHLIVHQRLARVGAALSIQVAYLGDDLGIAVTELPKPMLDELGEYFDDVDRVLETDVPAALDKARVMGRRMAEQIAALTRFLHDLEMCVAPGQDTFAFDESGDMILQYIYDPSQFAAWPEDATAALLHEHDAVLNWLKTNVMGFIISLNNIGLAFRETFKETFEQLFEQEILRLEQKAGRDRNLSQIRNDVEVRRSGLADQLAVRVCARDDAQCRLADLIGDVEDADVQRLARSVATHVFEGTGCKFYRRGDSLGQTSGRAPVFYACCGADCNHITKVVVFNGGEFTPASFLNEVKYQQVVHEAGLAPAINAAYLSDIGGVVVMDRLDVTLSDQIKQFAYANVEAARQTVKRGTFDLPAMRKRMFKGGARFVDEACNLLHELHQHDLMHGDAHAGNMMYTADCRKLMLIDFGRVHVVNKKDMVTARGSRKFNQNLFEWEYFQVVRDWREILRNQRGVSRDVTALQVIDAFVNGMEFQLEQRREAERREIEML